MHVWSYVGVFKNYESICEYTHMCFACLYQWACVDLCSYHDLWISKYFYAFIHAHLIVYVIWITLTKYKGRIEIGDILQATVAFYNFFYFAITIANFSFIW